MYAQLHTCAVSVLFVYDLIDCRQSEGGKEDSTVQNYISFSLSSPVCAGGLILPGSLHSG